ncbi:MAG: hypothetical protein L0387_02860 [Acidobacteria bacterium]|nr:hypothetical protein [Acidobacteriota bacterium]MCI0620605.1 hypothetical protein [Acidobacteriota bacterium]MCI0719973.1 hypothetical protein [Acidobacteriota bacterium]
MSTAIRSRARGTVIRVPDSNPGLLFIGSEQKAFTLEQIWRSPTAPSANMVVDVDLDGAGNITAITAVDAQQLTKERLSQFSGVAQEQGKQVAEIARQGVGALAARMGKVALIATVSAWIAWFFLPAGGINLGFLGSKSLTFWELLAIDLSNPMNMASGGSHGLFALIGLVAIAAPFAVPFLKHPQAKYLNAMLLAYLVLTPLKMWWDFNQAFGKAAGTAEGVFKEMADVISIGVGMYVLVIAGLVLTAQALKNRVSV